MHRKIGAGVLAPAHQRRDLEVARLDDRPGPPPAIAGLQERDVPAPVRRIELALASRRVVEEEVGVFVAVEVSGHDRGPRPLQPLLAFNSAMFPLPSVA